MLRYRRRNEFIFLDLHKLIFIVLIIRLLLCCIDASLLRNHIQDSKSDIIRGTLDVWTIHFITPSLMKSLKSGASASADTDTPLPNPTTPGINNQPDLIPWTILLTISDDYFDFFQNWWWFFLRLDLKARVIVIAEDGDVFRKIMSNYPDYAYVERTDLDIEEELIHENNARRKIAFSRISHILRYIKNNTNILYTDVDTVWLKNPISHFNGECDMWIQMEDELIFSTGFMAILNNKKTVKFMEKWRQILKAKSQDDRPVFNLLMKYTDVRPCQLDEKMFASGPTYKQLSSLERLNTVVVHNTNFELAHRMKLDRFRQWNLWNNETKIADSLQFIGNVNTTSLDPNINAI